VREQQHHKLHTRSVHHIVPRLESVWYEPEQGNSFTSSGVSPWHDQDGALLTSSVVAMPRSPSKLQPRSLPVTTDLPTNLLSPEERATPTSEALPGPSTPTPAPLHRRCQPLLTKSPCRSEILGAGARARAAEDKHRAHLDILWTLKAN